MFNLADIIKSIIEAIPRELQITSVVDSTLFVCETTGWLTINKIITINGLKYKITSIENNVSFVVEPYNHTTPVSLNTTEVIQNKITCFDGKPSAVNNEYLLIDEYTRNKTPFSWLYEDQDINGASIDSAFTAEYNNTRIFLLDWTDQAWNNSEHNNYVIKPMENLAKLIVSYVEGSYDFRKPEGYRIKKHVRFGVNKPNKGDNGKIIDEDLSGVELKINLQLYNLDFCKC
jgi:hypothetical protein